VAREKILHGATLLFDAVRVTLGPKSVLIQNSWGLPVVCNDSMTIAEPDLAHVMDAVDQFDVSKEVAARGCAQFHDSLVAVLVMKDARVLYIYRHPKFPRVCVF
jgi:chaperonin GroEL (HSP60 family)